MPNEDAQSGILRIATLRNTRTTRFELTPDAQARAALAAQMGIEAVRKARFAGSLSPKGRNGWTLEATLGATVVQNCIVTLDPVSTRLDLPVLRNFVPPASLGEFEAGSETEAPEDDSLEELGEEIDLMAILAEELSLALPAYPRKDGVALGSVQYAEQGIAPLTDEDTKPFASLAALREKFQDGEGNQ